MKVEWIDRTLNALIIILTELSLDLLDSAIWFFFHDGWLMANILEHSRRELHAGVLVVREGPAPPDEAEERRRLVALADK